MLTVNEAAAHLKLTAKWVRHLCNTGRFPGAKKLGGNGPGAKQWRIPQADLDNYMGEQPCTSTP